MGAIVEVHNDKNGIIWPEDVAPYQVHIIEVKSQNSKVKSEAEKLYNDLLASRRKNPSRCCYSSRIE